MMDNDYRISADSLWVQYPKGSGIIEYDTRKVVGDWTLLAYSFLAGL